MAPKESVLGMVKMPLWVTQRALTWEAVVKPNPDLWSTMLLWPSSAVQVEPMWCSEMWFRFSKRNPSPYPPVTAELPAIASRALPNCERPALAALPPPHPGQTKLRERPLATATMNPRNSSSAEEAAEEGDGTDSFQVICIYAAIPTASLVQRSASFIALIWSAGVMGRRSMWFATISVFTTIRPPNAFTRSQKLESSPTLP